MRQGLWFRSSKKSLTASLRSSEHWCKAQWNELNFADSPPFPKPDLLLFGEDARTSTVGTSEDLPRLLPSTQVWLNEFSSNFSVIKAHHLAHLKYLDLNFLIYPHRRHQNVDICCNTQFVNMWISIFFFYLLCKMKNMLYCAKWIKKSYPFS